jgi:thiamine pyrophosphokinase
MADRLAVILANGDLVEPPVLRARLESVRADFVVAADGGARHAAALGLRIDRLVGDFDSLSPAAREDLARAGTLLVRRPTGKDETDLELALLHALEAGATQAVVLGATGGRLDMTLANVQLLLHPALRGLSVRLWVGPETAYLVTPPGGDILGNVGDRISLIPLGGGARNVKTYGLSFPLNGETLAVGPARGVSNQVAQPGPRVELASGALLLIHAPQPDSESRREA